MNSNIKILRGSELTENDVRDALNLDYIVYPDEYHLREEVVLNYFRKNPNIYVFAKDVTNDKVVGYINFSPINDEAYEKLRSGKYMDTILSDRDIQIFEDNASYSFYFSSIVVHPEYRNQGIASMLIAELLSFLEELKSTRNISISRIVAIVISDAGYYIAEKVGMHSLYKTEDQSIIMERDNSNAEEI